MESALISVLSGGEQVLGYGDNNQFDECGADEGLMRARFKSLSRCIYWSAMTITTVVRLARTIAVHALHLFHSLVSPWSLRVTAICIRARRRAR